MLNTSEYIKKLAEFSGHHRDDVEQDLPFLRRMLTDKTWAIDKFFVKGDPWLWTPCTGFQQGIVSRVDSGHPLCCEVLPRGHGKTTLIPRSYGSLVAGLGQEPYTIIYSLTEEGWEGNLEATEMVALDQEFEDLQWFFNYAHGPYIARRRANRIEWGNGAITEFRSLLGESRGTNRPKAGGRPSLIILDDIIPTDAIDSETLRRKIVQRYLSMVRPMGRKGSRIIIVGTVMHIQDLIGLIITRKMRGFLVTPPQHRRAYDELTKKVLFPEKHTYGELMRTYQNEYVSTGNRRLWKREQLNDPSEDETHPFSQYVGKLNVFDIRGMGQATLMMDKTLAIDNAHGAGGDNFCCLEYWRGPDSKRYVAECVVSPTLDTAARFHEIDKFILRRRPNRIVIQRTSESIDFIEQMERHLREDLKVLINIETPTAGGTKGAKNARIDNWVQPVMDNDMLHVPGKITDDGVINHPQWVHHAYMEMGSFDKTTNNNVDDWLDTLALAEEASMHPGDMIPKIKTGNKVMDDLMNELLEEQQSIGKKKSRNPLTGGMPSWR